jgi:xylulokinase
MDLLLGLDVGTTATKALLFSLDGDVVASASHAYGLLTPHEGWVEQDPEDLWGGVVATCRALVAGLAPGDRIVALSQSSQAGTTIAVDALGRPTYNAISWMDGRATAQAERSRQELGEEFLYRVSGWPLFNGLPLQHVRWLRDERPDVVAATRRYVFVNDYVTWRLTGEYCMNPSDASITQFFNVARGDWDERMLGAAGVGREQLSPLQASGWAVGRLTAEASEATDLERDLLVVNGAHDQYCAAVGTGVTRPGRVLLSCGTAWVILAVPETLEAGLKSGMAMSCHAVPGRWGAVRSLGGVGTSLEWFVDHIWQAPGDAAARDDVYRAIDEAVERTPAGADGVLFFPLAGGHATTIGSGGGGFSGLTLSHARGALARAVMEGIAFELRWTLEQIRAAGVEVAELRMVGGAAKSSIWPRIVAATTATPVILPATTQAACRGAAILAGVGAGLFADAEHGFGAATSGEQRLVPSRESGQLYDDLFGRYQRHWHAAQGTAVS